MSWAAAASIGVGLLTSQSGSKSTSQKQEMDPAMRPYIFGGEGRKGLLDYNSEQLARSQSPERMAQWGNMMDRGQGLLGGSVAGNPFSSPSFAGGSSFGSPQGMTNGLAQASPSPYQAPVQQPAQQQQPPAFTIDDVIAEMKRKAEYERMNGGGGSGWSPDMAYGGNGV